MKQKNYKNHNKLKNKNNHKTSKTCSVEFLISSATPHEKSAFEEKSIRLFIMSFFKSYLLKVHPEDISQPPAFCINLF